MIPGQMTVQEVLASMETPEDRAERIAAEAVACRLHGSGHKVRLPGNIIPANAVRKES